MGIVNTPTTAYNQLMPALVGFNSRVSFVGLTIGGSYNSNGSGDKIVTVRIYVYNTTTSPIFLGAIVPASLPNPANWVLIQTSVLNFGNDIVARFYRSAKINYTNNSTVGTLVGGSLTDDYICTC